MSKAVMETICTTCDHRNICKFCKELPELYKQVNEIHIDEGRPYSIRVTCCRRSINYILTK